MTYYLDDTGRCCTFGQINFSIRMTKLSHSPVYQLHLNLSQRQSKTHAGEMNTGILLSLPRIVVFASASATFLNILGRK